MSLRWLDDLARWVGRLVPRLTLVPPTHAGVLFGPRGGAHDRGAGLILWWPICQQLHQIPITTQSMHVGSRCMPIAGPRGLVPTVTVAGLAVQYRVQHPVRAACAVLDFRALLDNRCQAAVGRHWRGPGSLEETLQQAREEMRPWLLDRYGIALERLDATHSGEVVGVIQIGDYGYADDGLPRGSGGAGDA